MRIQNDPQTIATNTTSFKSIKSIKLKGQYKNNAPELGQKLIDTFKKNPKAMDFCKKHDVNIVFNAHVNDGEYPIFPGVESSLYIFYDNPAVNKVKQFFKSLSLNGGDDKIFLFAWGGITDNLNTVTQALIKQILPNQPGIGNLDFQIELAEKKIDEDMAKKLNKKELKKESKETRQKLEDTIQDLIKSSN